MLRILTSLMDRIRIPNQKRNIICFYGYWNSILVAVCFKSQNKYSHCVCSLFLVTFKTCSSFSFPCNLNKRPGSGFMFFLLIISSFNNSWYEQREVTLDKKRYGYKKNPHTNILVCYLLEIVDYFPETVYVNKVKGNLYKNIKER